MPTIHSEGKYRFFFYSNEGSEPPHVHIELIGENNGCKYWLEDIKLAKDCKVKSKDLNKIEKIIVKNKKMFIEQFNKHLGRNEDN